MAIPWAPVSEAHCRKTASLVHDVTAQETCVRFIGAASGSRPPPTKWRLYTKNTLFGERSQTLTAPVGNSEGASGPAGPGAAARGSPPGRGPGGPVTSGRPQGGPARDR